MDAARLDAHRLLKEKTIRDCFLEDDKDNEMEEEEGAVDCYADDERKKKVTGRRGGPGGTSSPCCAVEKCGTDLTDARRYHRRHKVCETHSKAPVVIVAGLRQRFCQQCSRFHELSEFDETKRSCRRRLAGHNERRRKSTAETTGEGSSCRGVGPQLDDQCRQADENNRLQIPAQGNRPYKRS